MQVNHRPFQNIIGQQNNFEWTLEYQKGFDELKTLLIVQISNPISGLNQHIYAICDAPNFGIV